MEDKDYKDLDNFFKSRLNQTDDQSNGWDVPSDSILDAALDQVIPAKPKRRYPIYILLTLLLLSILVTSFILLRFQDRSKIEELQNQVTSLQQELEKKSAIEKTDDQKIFAPIENSKIKASPNKLPTKKPERVSNSKTSVDLLTNNPHSRTNKKKIAAITKPNFIKETKPTVTNNTINAESQFNNISENRNTVTLKPSTIRQTIVALNAIDQINAALAFESTPSLIMDDIELAKKRKKYKNLSTYLTIGHQLSSIKMTDLPTTNYSLTDYDKYYGGWEIGLGLAIDLTKRNRLKTDISYSIVNNESHFSENTGYIKNNELTNNDGNTYYTTDLDINSPTGNHIENFLIDVSNEDLIDGEQIGNFADIYQKFSVISLNAALTQTLFEKNDYQLELYAGIGLNSFISAKQDMNISVEHHDHEMASKTVKMDGMYALNRFYLNGRYGLEVSKLFSGKYFIGFSAGNNRSLTSIRKSNSNSGPKTFIGTFQTTLKVGYNF